MNSESKIEDDFETFLLIQSFDIGVRRKMTIDTYQQLIDSLWDKAMEGDLVAVKIVASLIEKKARLESNWAK